MATNPPPTQFDRWLTGFAGEEFSIIHGLYEWYKLLHTDVGKYPKTERYTLGTTMQARTLLILEGAWEAQAMPLAARLTKLDALQRTLDCLKILVRLAHDIGIYRVEGYIYRQQRLQDIGNKLGGWRRATRKKIGLDP